MRFTDVRVPGEPFDPPDWQTLFLCRNTKRNSSVERDILQLEGVTLFIAMGECNTYASPEALFAFAITDLVGNEAGRLRCGFAGGFVGVSFRHDVIPFFFWVVRPRFPQPMAQRSRSLTSGAVRAPWPAKDGGSARGNHLGSLHGPAAALWAIAQAAGLAANNI